MDWDINFWGVLLAFGASTVVGFVWYAPNVFGNKWMKLAKITEKKAKENSGGAMAKMVPLSLLQALLVAISASAVSGYYPEKTWLASALLAAAVLWLAQAAAMIIHDAFELRPWSLTVIHVGNQLATLLAMGFAVGLLKP